MSLELAAGEVDAFAGEVVIAFERIVAGADLVVVAEEGFNFQALDPVHAFGGVGGVADDIAEADFVSNSLSLHVREHGIKGFEVGMNVAKDGDFHERKN